MVKAARLPIVSAFSDGDPARSARALSGTLYAGGGVATIAGLHGLILGARAIPGVSEKADPVIESELRFFSAFYAGYGLLMLSVAARADREPAAAEALAVALFLGGVGRVAGWISVGKPNWMQRGLLALELGIPPLIAALSSAGRPDRGTR